MLALSFVFVSVCLWNVLCLAGVSMVTADEAGHCRLDNGECVYRVELVHGGHCGTGSNNGPVADNGNSHPVQSDSNKINDIEKRLQNVKLEHSKMISELQNKIDQMSTGIMGNSGQAKTNQINNIPQNLEYSPKKIHVTGQRIAKSGGRNGESDGDDLPGEFTEAKELGIPSDPNRTENSLLHGLHDKFTHLRQQLLEAKRRLKQKDQQLSLSRLQLNRTEETLKVSNEALKKSEKNRLETENKRKELSKLLQKKAKETNVIRNKLRQCRKQIKTKDTRIWALDSDLSELKKQLEECQEELKLTKQLLERALIKYHELNVRHGNLTVELNETKKMLAEQKSREQVTSFCGFEDPDICGYIKDNGTYMLEWIQWSMETPSHWTGPEKDHTCGNKQGHYMYVEATAMASDRKARLVSPHHGGMEEQCVEFYYHMYGRNIGTLNVILLVENRTTDDFPPPVWRAYGNQGNVWTMARLSVPQEVVVKGYQVVFEVFTAAGYAGDIAIDDIRVFVGKCFGSESLSQWRTKKQNHMLDVLRGK